MPYSPAKTEQQKEILRLQKKCENLEWEYDTLRKLI